MLHAKYIKNVLYCSIILIFVSGCCISIHNICAIRHYTLYIDPLMSDHDTQIIAHFVQEYVNAHGYTQLNSSIKQQFPWIDFVELKHKVPGHAYITVHGSLPLICVNQNKIILHNGHLVPITYFTHIGIFRLPHMNLQNSEKITHFSTELMESIKELASARFEPYTAHWYDPTHIILCDKQINEFCIIVDCNTIRSAEKMQHCYAIKDRMWFTEAKRNKKQKVLVADIRFNNQIIVAWRNEGIV